jgi:hypothetical protein
MKNLLWGSGENNIMKHIGTTQAIYVIVGLLIKGLSYIIWY